MDLYSNNGMLDWESNRRVAELRAMAARHEIDSPEKREEQRDEPGTTCSSAGTTATRAPDPPPKDRAAQSGATERWPRSLFEQATSGGERHSPETC
jgi:hypothetical protein